jgi:hypothetical protein
MGSIGILRGVFWANELSLYLVVGNNQLYTSSFKNRQPTNQFIFDSEFNRINENGKWAFKSLTATTITCTNLIYGEDIDVEDKITSIETTIASHTDDIALNSANILTEQDTITSLTDLECNSLTASNTILNGVNVESSLTLIETTLDQKQDILQAGTGIGITNNVIYSTSTSSFVGFRAVTAQGIDLNISINTVIPLNSVSVNTFAFDTENMFDTTASSYTIPTGYSGYWGIQYETFHSGIC